MIRAARLGPGDRLALILSSLVVFGATVLGTIRLSGTDPLPGASVCVSRLLLGRNCPGCGLTRSFVTLAGGDFRGAMAFNPAGPPLFVLLIAVVVSRLIKRARPDARTWRYVDAALGAAIVLTLVTRSVLFYLS